jgi:predicted membrane-bound mannosyltransferase
LLRWNDAERRNIFIEIVFIFTLLLLLIYSIIPYKTPWSMMTFWTGIAVVAAYGISESLKIFPRLKLYLIIIISAGTIHQAWQSYKISFSYQFHPQNPFVYAQATDDMAVISKTISNIYGAAADKEKTSICIAAAGDDYWPLPWYLRSFKNAGWFNRIPGDVHRYPIILTRPEFETELLEKLYLTPPPGERNLYIPLFRDYMELRPGVEIRGYVRKDFYDFYRNNRTD